MLDPTQAIEVIAALIASGAWTGVGAAVVAVIRQKRESSNEDSSN